MPIVGMAYQQWFFWDGRKDSLWSQTLEPLENPLEHGISRVRVAQLVYQYYREQYIEIFGQFPGIPLDLQANEGSRSADAWVDFTTIDREFQWQSLPETTQNAITLVFVNIGKSIAAFVRLIVPTPSNFDHYVEGIDNADGGNEILSTQQINGLRLFVGKAKCVNCHNGPMLTNGEFHHAGVPDTGTTDFGRSAAMSAIRKNEFGYFSKWSDADPQLDGNHIRFLDTNSVKYERSFKTPSLRNVSIRAPFTHTGQFDNLADVLEAYTNNSGVGLADELFHSDLTNEELSNLEAFLESLSSEPTIKIK